jgi:hypothetical protein
MKTNQDPQPPASEADEARDVVSRREFLRNSVYAAYATPLITSLLVVRSSAAQSGPPTGGGWETFCERNPWHQKCLEPPP